MGRKVRGTGEPGNHTPKPRIKQGFVGYPKGPKMGNHGEPEEKKENI